MTLIKDTEIHSGETSPEAPCTIMLSILWNDSNLVTVESFGDNESNDKVGIDAGFMRQDSMHTDNEHIANSRMNLLTDQETKLMCTGYLRRLNTNYSIDLKDISSILFLYTGSQCTNARIAFNKPSDASEGLDTSLILFKLKDPNKLLQKYPKFRITFCGSDCNKSEYKYDGYNFKIGLLGLKWNQHVLDTFENEFQKIKFDSIESICKYFEKNKNYNCNSNSNTSVSKQYLDFQHETNKQVNYFSLRETTDKKRSHALFPSAYFDKSIFYKNYVDNDFLSSKWQWGRCCLKKGDYVTLIHDQNDYNHQIIKITKNEETRLTQWDINLEYYYYLVFECTNCQCEKTKGFQFEFYAQDVDVDVPVAT